MDYERKIVKITLRQPIGPYNTIEATFEAERFPGCELLDTYVEFNIDRFGITWKDKEKLLEELASVIEKYQI